MIVVEICSGTESMAKAFRAAGHEVFTVDIDPKLKPDMVADVRTLSLSQLPPPFNKPDFIHASPPCETWSVASLGHHWTGGFRAWIPKTKACVIGVEVLEACIRLIREGRCLFTMENPRGGMRKYIEKNHADFHALRNTVTYCQYGDDRMKPTDFWSNVGSWIPKPICKNGMPCHEAAPRGAKTGTQGKKGALERGRIPELLCKEIVSAVEKAMLKQEVSA